MQQSISHYFSYVFSFSNIFLDTTHISMIAAKYDLPLHYPYVIFNPQVDPTAPQAWIRPDSETTLHSSFLKTDVSFNIFLYYNYIFLIDFLKHINKFVNMCV